MQKEKNAGKNNQEILRKAPKEKPFPKTKKPKVTAEKNLAPKKLKLLITVVNRNKAEFYMDILQSFEVNMQICMLAEGTANYQMRHILGLEDSERAMIWSVIREDQAIKALKTLEEKFQTVRNGKGIAYTIPLSSVMGVAIYQFLSNNRMVREDK